MSDDPGWRIPEFRTPDPTDPDDLEAWAAYYEGDTDREPRAVHPDFIEPDDVPEVETVDPGEYL